MGPGPGTTAAASCSGNARSMVTAGETLTAQHLAAYVAR